MYCAETLSPTLNGTTCSVEVGFLFPRLPFGVMASVLVLFRLPAVLPVTLVFGSKPSAFFAICFFLLVALDLLPLSSRLAVILTRNCFAKLRRTLLSLVLDDRRRFFGLEVGSTCRCGVVGYDMARWCDVVACDVER